MDFFVHIVSTGDFSEQEALTTELYLQLFSLYFQCISTVFDA